MFDAPVISQNDRTMAGLAHLAIIVPFWGMIAPIVIWATQKDKSKFIVFQAIQALVYQVLLILVTMLGMGCYMVSFFSMFSTISSTTSESSTLPAGFFLPFAVMGGIFIVYLVFIIYGIVAAVLTFTGKNFRYVILGGWIEKYMNRGS
jgi:uncharacterized Tic20 family protein